MPTNHPYRLGVDLGGTKIETILLDPRGDSLGRERTATPRDANGPTEYARIRDKVQTVIEDTLRKVPEGADCTIGIGIPGTINADTGRVQNANTTGLIGHPFQRDLEQRLGRPIAMENDANCLGGGVSNIDELYTLGLEQVRRYAFHEHIRTPILKNRLGDSAGVIGAAWIGK